MDSIHQQLGLVQFPVMNQPRQAQNLVGCWSTGISPAIQMGLQNLREHLRMAPQQKEPRLVRENSPGLQKEMKSEVTLAERSLVFQRMAKETPEMGSEQGYW